LNNTFQ